MGNELDQSARADPFAAVGALAKAKVNTCKEPTELLAVELTATSCRGIIAYAFAPLAPPTSVLRTVGIPETAVYASAYVVSAFALAVRKHPAATMTRA